MKIVRLAVFAVCFILLATLVLGGFSFATPRKYSAPLTLEYPTTMCTFVKVNSGLGCEEEGIRACKMYNVGHCFQQCTTKVRSDCNSFVKLPTYALPEGFEDSFSDEPSCVRYVITKCSAMTRTDADYQQCARRGEMRCSLIGRLKV